MKQKENAEDNIAPAAYGIWEGIQPHGKIDEEEAYVQATEEETLQATYEGMSGGRLPDSYTSIEAELYAIFAYLQKCCKMEQGDTRAQVSERKVLIISDCRACLMELEQVYRQGNAEGTFRKDRGAMMEAICNLRSQLGTCVFLWTSSHDGATPSSYADLVAKTYLTANSKINVTEQIATHIQTRPCIYERRIWTEEGETWEIADKRAYREGRLRARADIRKRLSKDIKPGAITAGYERPIWAEIARAALKQPAQEKREEEDENKEEDKRGEGSDKKSKKKDKGEKLVLEDILLYNERTKITLGTRVQNILGVMHNRTWLKAWTAEQRESKQGIAHHSQVWGCAACRQQRIQQSKNSNALKTTEMRQREYTIEQLQMQQGLDNPRHFLSGKCQATNVKLMKELEENIDKLYYIVAKEHGKGKGAGADTKRLLGNARAAV